MPMQNPTIFLVQKDSNTPLWANVPNDPNQYLHLLWTTSYGQDVPIPVISVMLNKGLTRAPLMDQAGR